MAISNKFGILYNKKIVVDTIVNDKTIVASAETTYSLDGSYKFSDYELLIFTTKAGSTPIRKTFTVPRNAFISSPLLMQELHGASSGSASNYSVSSITVTYVNNTQFKAQRGSAGAFDHIDIYGVRFG